MLSVDVVIPTFNRADTIGRTIDSVLAQTYPVGSIIVVDDGSRDRTEEVVATYGGKVRYVRQTNAGPAAARNNGIHEAAADWVAFVDSDDYWKPAKIQRQVEALSRVPGAVLCYTSALEVAADGSESVVDRAVTPGQAPELLRYLNFVPMSAAMARRDQLLELGGFDTSLKGPEDWDMWFRLSRRGPFAGVAEPLTVIVETAGSVSANVDGMLENTQRLIDKTLVADLAGLRRQVWRRRILSAECYRGFITMRERKAAGSMKYLRRSLLLWPSPLFLPKRFASFALAMRHAVK